MSAKKPTSSDVARLAGVSQTAVSMILNRKAGTSFSEDTVARVHAAAKNLGYHITKEKKGSTDKLIAVFVPAPGNPYYSTLVQSLENEAPAHGYHLLVCNTYYDNEKENRYLDILDSDFFMGAIFTSMPQNATRVKALSEKLPIIIIGDKTDKTGLDTVSINSFGAGVVLAEHLLALGHKKVAFISTQLNNNTARLNRYLGVKQTFENAGCELLLDEADVNLHVLKYSMNLEHNVGFEAASRLSGDKSITAYIGVNDMVAYGIIDALKENGIRVPEERSVCGFDNIFPSFFQGVNLTTVDSFLWEKGHDAFDLLLRKMSDSPASKNPAIYRIDYNPRIIERNSSGPAPKK